MSSSRIVLLCPEGHVMFEGVSVLESDEAPRTPLRVEPIVDLEAPFGQIDDVDPDACPPTQRSRDAMDSGIFSKSGRAA